MKNKLNIQALAAVAIGLLAEADPAPYCFGSEPSPQDQAEKDCATCPVNNQCLRKNVNA